MKLVGLKPTLVSKRHCLNIYSPFLNQNPILKKKILKIKQFAGRNNTGKITIKHKTNFNKKLYRIINFNIQIESTGIVFSIEYDPNRTGNIAAVYNLFTKQFFYILAAKNLKPGNIIKTGKIAQQKTSNIVTLNQIIIGCPIFNINKFCRAAGTHAVLLNKNSMFSTILLSSGTKILLNNAIKVTVGIVSNDFLFLKQLAKAGRRCWLNRKSIVRGVAMNAVDHPNGGGNGKKSSLNKSPWGKISK